MKLRSKLIALSALTLLLPWSGWMLLQELESFLRDAQENAMLPEPIHPVAGQDYSILESLPNCRDG